MYFKIKNNKTKPQRNQSVLPMRARRTSFLFSCLIHDIEKQDMCCNYKKYLKKQTKYCKSVVYYTFNVTCRALIIRWIYWHFIMNIFMWNFVHRFWNKNIQYWGKFEICGQYFNKIRFANFQYWFTIGFSDTIKFLHTPLQIEHINIIFGYVPLTMKYFGVFIENYINKTKKKRVWEFTIMRELQFILQIPYYS